MPTSKHLDGALVVNKPPGPTSHDVVAVARRALGSSKVGHTGTLDPNASGVLPLVVGRATRLAKYLSASEKAYDATIRFGLDTDTYDTMGRVVRETGLTPALADLESALVRFRGAIEQAPPAYSAKMIDRERAYARARRGAPVQPGAVAVIAHALELGAYEPPLARVRLVCSPGFYVRSLAHDLGAALGTGAVLEALVRTASAGFTLADAVPLALVATAARADVAARVVPMEGLLGHLPAVSLTAEGARRARHGLDLGPADLASAPAMAPLVRLLSPEGTVIGLAEPAKTPGFLHPAVVLA